METVQVPKNAYTIDDAMNVVFSKLDEAIDDMEQGRVISEEEMWAELDAIQVGTSWIWMNIELSIHLAAEMICER